MPVTATTRVIDLQQVVFPTTTSAGATYPLSGVLTATTSHVYTFNPASLASASYPVTVTDRATNVTTTNFLIDRDDIAPAVTVSAPSRLFTSTIPVTWSAADSEAGPTGVYTVSVMTDTGPLQPWLAGTSLTSGNFTGVLGHRYTFVVTTTDRVNNLGQGTAETVATQVTKYYYIGSSRVAMRQGDAVTYLHTDHLGTVSVATSGNGQFIARTLNLPYGGVRWTDGTMPTDYSFTGQKLDASTGLHYYHARYYSSFAGRFVSADTVVPEPGNPQAWNRFTYVKNSPLKYIDPSGHREIECNPGEPGCDRNGRQLPDGRDLTDWLVRELRTNATGSAVGLIQHLFTSSGHEFGVAATGAPAAYVEWYRLNHDGARFDFKDRIDLLVGESIMLCGLYDCGWYDYSTPGNIHYGFVGAASGFSLETLHFGASYAEITDPDHANDPEENLINSFYFQPEWASTMYDDPLDYNAIEFGYALYRSFGPDLTVEQLQWAFTLYAKVLNHPLQTSAVPTQPYYNPDWPYPVGYFNGGQ